MYILNENIDIKAKIAAMVRRLEELEMKKMQEVQAISQTPLQPMSCAICLSYEHLVNECPTIPAAREMLAFPQASNLEQAMVNRTKIMEDFVEAQKSINAQLSQRIDSANEGESSQKREVKEVITLRNGKEVDLPTSKLKHKVESETERKKRGEISKEVKGSHREPKELKNRGTYAPAKISQPKEPLCETSLSLRNPFAAKRTMLRD
ncbi:hypothetical protein CK203_117693 [Vitis vinifera]|uniref:Uncharacterized protein n=1 Tax=Vitis vinifera TaxID=29760 RepID=A0A438C801_VITVI|nr:hypothetical protein CK203_117693 [Vitis vinifera]